MTDRHEHSLEGYYIGFPYPATDLSKFIAAGNIFTIMLKAGDIIHFTPDDTLKFKKWLNENGITDIR